jgi:class 3 adenylate cyclase
MEWSYMNSKESFLEQMIGFLPQNFVEFLIKNPDNDLITDSINEETAVLFSDISGFTTMSEALSRIGDEGAEEMSRILNNYFENIEEIVRNHEGYIQKTAGDSRIDK